MAQDLTAELHKGYDAAEGKKSPYLERRLPGWRGCSVGSLRAIPFADRRRWRSHSPVPTVPAAANADPTRPGGCLGS
jgi:hypothetical protein